MNIFKSSKTCGEVSSTTATDGSVTVTVSGGCPSYSISWTSTSSTNPSAGDFNPTGLATGTYTATITDANGCTAVQSVTLTAPPPMVASITNPSCGALDLTVTGGCNSKTFVWTTTDGKGISNPTSEDQSGLTSGTYNVLITDANGATATSSYTIIGLRISSGENLINADWGTTGVPQVLGSWIFTPAKDKISTTSSQFSVYPSDFTVTAYPSLSLTVKYIGINQPSGLWGLAMAYNGPSPKKSG